MMLKRRPLPVEQSRAYLLAVSAMAIAFMWVGIGFWAFLVITLAERLLG